MENRFVASLGEKTDGKRGFEEGGSGEMGDGTEKTEGKEEEGVGREGSGETETGGKRELRGTQVEGKRERGEAGRQGRFTPHLPHPLPHHDSHSNSFNPPRYFPSPLPVCIIRIIHHLHHPFFPMVMHIHRTVILTIPCQQVIIPGVTLSIMYATQPSQDHVSFESHQSQSAE